MTQLLRSTLPSLTVICSLVFCATVHASVVTPNGDLFPVPQGTYTSQAPATASTIDTEILSMQLRSVGPASPLPARGESFFVDSFFDVFVELRVGGGDFQVDSFFDITYRIELPPSSPGGTFETEMISMQLVGPGPNGPDTVIIRNAPTQRSLGIHSVEDLGGGQFQVDSFFDIWTEVSIDGGTSFHATDSPLPMMLTSIPEPACAWFCLVACGANALIRRR